MKRSGTADLPLHGGRVPVWLAERMTKLGTAICEKVIYEYGASELLSRLSDPCWFQALGCVLGMDWHSSGITTSVLGALKRGLNPLAHETGVYLCGGRGSHSRKTPEELFAIADKTGLDANALVRSSRLTARIDNNAVADGFQLYLHGFVLTSTGEWAVIQQGMNEATGMARRYHWHSASVRSFTLEPHTAIVGEHQGIIMNLVDRHAQPAQKAMLALAHEPPSSVLEKLRSLHLPARHQVQANDVDLNRLGAVLAVAHEKQLHDFAALLLTEKLGPRTLQALALVAEVVHGTPTRFSDPARFAFAHGGKDGHPFPVPLKIYDESIAVLRHSLERAKLAPADRTDGFKRLDRFVHYIEERNQPRADFEKTVAHERAISRALDGRSVFEKEKEKTATENPRSQGLPDWNSSSRLSAKSSRQLKLF